MKKTKLEILTKLLQDKIITIEEFIILNEKEYIHYSYPPTKPYNPHEDNQIYCQEFTIQVINI